MNFFSVEPCCGNLSCLPSIFMNTINCSILLHVFVYFIILKEAVTFNWFGKTFKHFKYIAIQQVFQKFTQSTWSQMFSYFKLLWYSSEYKITYISDHNNNLYLNYNFEFNVSICIVLLLLPLPYTDNICVHDTATTNLI